MTAIPRIAYAEHRPLTINMETAVRVGVANHFALEAIRGRRKAAEELITERWRQYLPSLGIGYNRTNDIAKDGADNVSHEIRLTIEQVLYDGGRRSLDLDLARLDAILAREDFRITYNQLRLEIMQSYLSALAASGKIKLSRKSLERSLIQLHQARRESELGFGTHLQVMNVAARVQEIELNLRKSVNEYKQAIYDLKLAMNLDADLELQLAGDLFRDFTLRPPSVDMTALHSRSLSERPEVLRSRIRLHQLKKELEIAESYWIPRFKVGTYIGRRGEEFPVREKTWGITFGITMPLGGNTTTSDSAVGTSNDQNTNTSNNQNQIRILDDLSSQRKIMEGKIALGEGLAEDRKVRQQVTIELNRAYTSLREAWEQIHIGNSRVFFQYETTRLMATRYETGEVKRSEIVFAETELVQAQNDLTDAFVGYMKAALQLEFAAGMGPLDLNLFQTTPAQGNSFLARILDGDIQSALPEKDQKSREEQIELDKELIDRINKSLEESRTIIPPNSDTPDTQEQPPEKKEKTDEPQ